MERYKDELIRVAINGFGRIGRAFFKIAFERPEFEFVAINDLGELETLAYLLRYDTVYRRYDQEVKTSDGSLVVGGKKIKVLSEKDPGFLPWKELDIDVVVESTGRFNDLGDAEKHLKAGAKRVVITAPAKGDVPYTLIGANDALFTGDLPLVTSHASCTTNAAVPVVAVMMGNPGVIKGVLNTVHGYTATQSLVDGPAAKDLRWGRAAAMNIIPSSTGAAESVVKSLTGLEGIFDGIALRVPVICGSIVDFTFLAKRKTSVVEVNRILQDASQEPRWEKVLTVTEEPIVSSDIIGDTHASIVDMAMTRVVAGDLVKVLAWYDNEWGYSFALAEHIVRVGKLIKS